MKHKAPVIALTGGGSGGHITPLLSLARELKTGSPDCQIVYIGSKGDSVDSFKDISHDFDFLAFIKAGKFRRYHGMKLANGIFRPGTMALNVRDFFRLPGSILSARRVLKKFEPDVVFSKGGFVALPVGLAAKSLAIPIVTHDSDTVPGLANRIVGRWAKTHATGMPPKYYSYPERSIEYVGIPIDGRIKKVTPKIQRQMRQKLNLPQESQVLLVSGGGNGSKRLNNLMLTIARELLETNLSLYIIHLTGPKHEKEVKLSYKSLPKTDQKRVITIGYSNDFYALSAASDLVLSRAGATTLAELAAAGKTCVVIPAPFLAGGHQLKNAQWLGEHDAAVILPEEVQADELQAVIKSLLGDDSRRFELARNLYATAKHDASARLAELILKIARAEQS